MGTSASSKGPGNGVSFDPPWLDQVPAPTLPGNELPETDIEPPKHTPPDDIAPPARFRAARLNLGKYISSGDRSRLGKALGNYSRTGMGGSASAAQRMRVSSKTATSLFGLLKTASTRATAEIRSWVDALVSRNADAQEIADEIVSLISTSGGSLDEASAQNSMALALEDLLLESPDIDLLNLDESDIWSIVASFLGHELFNRVYLDIGQAFESSPLPPQTIMERKNSMRDYIHSDIFAQIEVTRKSGVVNPEGHLTSIFNGVLQRTLAIYEGELE